MSQQYSKANFYLFTSHVLRQLQVDAAGALLIGAPHCLPQQ